VRAERCRSKVHREVGYICTTLTRNVNDGYWWRKEKVEKGRFQEGAGYVNN
jgi:hypothetical protein